MLAKVYYNALMTSLNSRRSQERMNNVEHSGGQAVSTTLSQSGGLNKPFSTFMARSCTPTVSEGGKTVVRISTSTEQLDDLDPFDVQKYAKHSRVVTVSYCSLPRRAAADVRDVVRYSWRPLSL